MVQLANFKRQHQEIRELVNMTTALLDHSALEKDPTQVRYKLSALSGKLLIHLSMEDQFLYPILMEQDDRQLQTTARKFLAEMGDLVTVFKNYSQKWISPSSIKANPAAFIKESTDILHALLQRIEREDRELYPLVEAAPSLTNH